MNAAECTTRLRADAVGRAGVRYIVQMRSHDDSVGWLVPDWPAPAHVGSVCTTRAGGVSRAPFASLNLGSHVGDDPAAVRSNRARLASWAGVQPVYLQQVHGVQVARLDEIGESLPEDRLVADACYTTEPGRACTIMVADCLPVLVTHRCVRIVGAAHAGWRGLAGSQGKGVLEQLLQGMQAAVPDAASDGWLAWLGPCIGPTAFEVGDEVRDAFMAGHRDAADGFVAQAQAGKWLADLPALARQRLASAGVTAVFGNDGSSNWCTWTQTERFFSYRRSARTGRFAALVWLEGEGK